MWQLHTNMKPVYISHKICCVPGPVNNWSILWSRKNQINCVTDHAQGLEKDLFALFDMFFVQSFFKGNVYKTKCDM